jgi:hypothetical protein
MISMIAETRRNRFQRVIASKSMKRGGPFGGSDFYRLSDKVGGRLFAFP